MIQWILDWIKLKTVIDTHNRSKGCSGGNSEHSYLQKDGKPRWDVIICEWVVDEEVNGRSFKFIQTKFRIFVSRKLY